MNLLSLNCRLVNKIKCLEKKEFMWYVVVYVFVYLCKRNMGLFVRNERYWLFLGVGGDSRTRGEMGRY